jgi:sugar lactone lactonase YvrE
VSGKHPKTKLSLATLVLALAAAALLCSGRASAATTRAFTSQITEANGVPLARPTGLAVDGTDHLWVTEEGPSGTVDKYSPTGVWEAHTESPPWSGSSIESLAFSSLGNEVFVSESSKFVVDGLDPATAAVTKKELSAGVEGHLRIAADNSSTATNGDLYIFGGEFVGEVVRIDTSGNPVNYTAGSSKGTNRLTHSFGTPNPGGGLAVDSAGRLYVTYFNFRPGVVDIFAPSGEFLKAITEAAGEPLGEELSGPAVDPTSGNLLVADNATHVIDEFNSAGVLEGRITKANNLPLGVIGGLAVSSIGVLYVADEQNKLVDVFAPAVPLLTATTGPASNLTVTGLTLHGSVNPAGVPLTACHFQYVTQEAFNSTGFSNLSSGGEHECEPPFGSIPSSGVTPVSAAISGLKPGVVYRYRLLVANASEANAGEARAIPQIVLRDSVTNVSASSADLGGEIEPGGLTTEYHFEYLTQASYEANGDSFSGPQVPSSVPVPDGSVAAGSTPVTVSQHITGLIAAAAYRFRLLAHNALGETSGEEHTFTTQGGGGELVLPDGRQWELVSPPDKHGGTLVSLGVEGITQAAASGGAVSYRANAPIEDGSPGSGGVDVQVLSTRGATGWSSRDIAPPHEHVTGTGLGAGEEYRFFSEDLSAAIVQPFGRFEPQLSPEASEQTPYLRTLGGCASSCYHPIVTGQPGFENVPPGTHFGEERWCEEEEGRKARVVCGPHFLDATGDLGHVVLLSAPPLVNGAPRGTVAGEKITGSLYEWSEGRFALVSVLPPNEAGEELPAPVGSAHLGFDFGESNGSDRRAISSDGSRIFWEANSTLYLRDMARHKTLQIDAAEAACLEEVGSKCESGGGHFEIASADGSRVLFTDTHRLTKGAGAKAGAPDLYECKITEGPGGPSCELADLTPLSGSENANVQGSVLGAGEDGSTVYFVADGKLGVGSKTGSCNGTSVQSPGAACNLYVRRGATTSLVATLSGVDRFDWEAGAQQSPRVSPNGRWLAFMSEQSLTGYDNRDAASGQLDAEVYLYDANSGSLVCASCNPTGARPTGANDVQIEGVNGEGLVAGVRWEPTGVAALLPAVTTFQSATSAYHSRVLSNDGRLFLNSLDALVPQDVNGNWDVYEYEPASYVNSEGKHPCTTETSTFGAASRGCTSLISSGASAQQSAFLDASESGGDVFFLTSAKLTSQDIDANFDVYDAHECTVTSPCIPPPTVAPPPCGTEASCKPSPTPQPSIFGAPASVMFSGPGNLAPAPPKPKTAAQIRAERLAKALRACRAKRNRHKRSACARHVRKQYGSTHKAKKTNKRNK